MRIPTTIFLFLVLFFTVFALAKPIFVQANGAEDCPEGYVCILPPTKCKTIGCFIESITEWLKIIAIPLGGIMIVWGGIMIMTAGDSRERAIRGKKTLMWAIIGVTVVLAVDSIVGLIQELLQ